jgi:hypothetical protein
MTSAAPSRVRMTLYGTEVSKEALVNQTHILGTLGKNSHSRLGSLENKIPFPPHPSPSD